MQNLNPTHIYYNFVEKRGVPTSRRNASITLSWFIRCQQLSPLRSRGEPEQSDAPCKALLFIPKLNFIAPTRRQHKNLHFIQYSFAPLLPTFLRDSWARHRTKILLSHFGPAWNDNPFPVPTHLAATALMNEFVLALLRLLALFRLGWILGERRRGVEWLTGKYNQPL